MKRTLEDTEKIVDLLADALQYAKLARHEAKRVYSNDTIITMQLKYCYASVQEVTRFLEDGQ